MQAFIWTPQFVTGLSRVDEQHQHLVDMVNQVGDLLLNNDCDETTLQALFDDLARYATEHFSEEEALMARWAVDPRHADLHTRHHREFVEQLVSMWERRQQSANAPALLHGFLASWLTMHILGEDQRMARMIAGIERGLSPADAYAQEVDSGDPGMSALLGALYQLYGMLAKQNRELQESNLRLEEKVAERTQRLAQANTQLQKEQADLKAALRQIEASSQQLLNAEKMASLARLIAGFAHEMNTPLGVAVGATSNADLVLARIDSLLAGDEVDADVLQANLETLREGNRLATSNLHRAGELVQRIKQSSLEQDTLSEQHFSLRACIEDLLTGLKRELNQRGVSVTLNCPPNLMLNSLPGLYEQIFMTLIDNALHHAFPAGHPGPHIELTVTRAGQHLQMLCQDNGQGMTHDIAAHVFEPFFTTQRSQGRPGLGLYLCYTLVASKLGGSIECDSTPGNGTLFTLSIPFNAPEGIA